MTSTDRDIPRGLNGYDVLAGHANHDGLTLLTTPHRWQWRPRRAGQEPKRDGSRLIAFSAGLLFLLGLGLLSVSIAAQYRYFLAERHQITASMIESGALDAGMIIFALLALGAARKGLHARPERVLIVACAAASALMNYANANAGDWRSVAAWIMPPAFLAVVADRVIAITRRHFLGMSAGRSAWSDAASGAAKAARASAFLALYIVRFLLAPPSTAKGVRQAVLDATPLPQPPVTVVAVNAAVPVTGVARAAAPRRPRAGGSKKAALLGLYRQHEGYGDKNRVSRIAAELAPLAGLQAGTARTYLGEAVRQIGDDTR